MHVAVVVVKFILNLLLLKGYFVVPANSWTCGHVRGRADVNRIVGGYDVGYYKYPWFASLMIQGFVNCGGTLIAPKFVVTAAHCYKDFIKAKQNLEAAYNVSLGTYDRCKKEETAKTYQVKKVFVHEEYIERDPYFDITLLLLNDDTNDYMPICLPKKALTSDTRGKEGYITGYGVLKYHTNFQPCKIREARVKIYSDDACRKMLTDAEDNGDQLINGVCAGYLEGGIDSCQGDSGGPLMILGNHGETVLLGITSFGYECASKDVLGMYTDVSHYLDWLSKKANHTITDGVPMQLATTEKPTTTKQPPPALTDFPWNEGQTESDENNGDNHHHIVIPISSKPQTIIIYIPKKKKKGHHHHFLRRTIKRKVTKNKNAQHNKKSKNEKDSVSKRSKTKKEIHQRNKTLDRYEHKKHLN